MTRPTRNPKTDVYRVRITIPPHLRDIIKRDHGVRQEFQRSLGTKVEAEARRLATPVLLEFQNMIAAAEAEYQGKSVRLTDHEISALCGQWLAKQEERSRADIPEPLSEYAAADEFLTRLLGPEEHSDGFTMTDAALYLQEDLTALLASRGDHIDADSRRRLVRRLAHTKLQHVRDMLERAKTGQWRPTISSSDFASPSHRLPDGSPAGVVTIDAILTGWAADRGWKLDMKPQPRTLYDRVRTAERLAIFLGHRDAQRIAKADAVRWKEDMQARDASVSTIRNDLSEMSAIWKDAIRQGKIQGTNPFEGVSPPKPKRPKKNRRSYTDGEAVTILTAARGQKGFLRWLPWLCCLTGARLAEAVQGAKEDVTQIDGAWTLRIHDDGDDDGAGGVRSVKNAESVRTIPLHPALIAEGFVKYVQSLPNGSPLFPDCPPDKQFGLRSTTAGKRMSRWLKAELKITDATISPAHSWRHWFIDAARKAQIHPEVRSALTGHSAKMDESAGYGGGMGSFMDILAAAMAKVKLPAGIAPTEDGRVP